MISVIVPSYRNPKCLDICLHSALTNASDKSVEIIVVLDGYVEESQHIIEKYKDRVKFIPLEHNAGMQHALNIGVFAANNEWILIVNDDNVFPHHWDTQLKREADYSSSLKVSNIVITPNQIERTRSIFDFIVADFGTPDTFDFDEFTKTEPSFRDDRIVFMSGEIFPFMMRKQYYMAVGGFDTIYDSPFICDWDFFLKLELIDATFIRTHIVNFYHFGSMATKNGNERDRFNASEIQAADTFKYKWGFDPIRNGNNTHRPFGKTVRGITYAQ